MVLCRGRHAESALLRAASVAAGHGSDGQQISPSIIAVVLAPAIGRAGCVCRRGVGRGEAVERVVCEILRASVVCAVCDRNHVPVVVSATIHVAVREVQRAHLVPRRVIPRHGRAWRRKGNVLAPPVSFIDGAGRRGLQAVVVNIGGREIRAVLDFGNCALRGIAGAVTARATGTRPESVVDSVSESVWT